MENCCLCKNQKKLDELAFGKKCSKHKYCFKCLSKIVIGKECAAECDNCRKYVNDDPRKTGFFSRKKCKKCKIESIKCKICKKHNLCQYCFFYNKSDGLPKDIADCILCTTIILHSCQNCFLILDENEKRKKSGCRDHIYCEDCSFKPALYCHMCRESDDRLSSQTLVSSINRDHSQSLGINMHNNSTNYLVNNSVTISDMLMGHPSNGLQAKISFNYEQYNHQMIRICDLCNQEPGSLLECSHISCENCIKNRVLQDAQQLIYLMNNGLIEDLNIFEPCIRCPISNCLSRYIQPFNSDWFRELPQISNYYFQFVADFFNGVRFIFMQCQRCGISGHVNRVCSLCNQTN